MRRMIANGSLVLTAVAVVALCSQSWAQATEADENQRLNMESHVGKLTGHADAAKSLTAASVLVATAFWGMAKARMPSGSIPSRATLRWGYSTAVRPRLELCP